MASKEDRLFYSSRILKDGSHGTPMIFRTRKACTEWRVEQRCRGYATTPTRAAAWGPNQ